MTASFHRIGLAFLACVALFGSGCTPASRAWIPGMAAVDQTGMAVAKIMNWCENSGVDQADVLSTLEMYRAGNKLGATVEALTLAASAYEATGKPPPVDVQDAIGETINALILVDDQYRLMGEEPPPEVRAAIEKVVGYAIANGMRALSGGE